MITLVHFRNKQYLNKYNKVSDPNALRTWAQFIKRCREKWTSYSNIRIKFTGTRASRNKTLDWHVDDVRGGGMNLGEE